MVVVLRVVLVAHLFNIAFIFAFDLFFSLGDFVRLLIVSAFISLYFVALLDNLRALVI